jgi:hypothetical protein
MKMKEELKQQRPEGQPTPTTSEQRRVETDAPARQLVGPPDVGSRAKRGGSGGQGAKRRRGLDPEVLATIGKGLRVCFPDVDQEVPERFKKILQQF